MLQTDDAGNNSRGYYGTSSLVAPMVVDFSKLNWNHKWISFSIMSSAKQVI